MKYEEFLQQSGKTELLSFFRRYENSMDKRKKFVSLKEYYEKEQKETAKKFEKAMEDVTKVAKDMPVPKYDPMEPLKGGEDSK